MSKQIKVVVTTGGTGGHVFPAEALAEELQKKYDVTFVGGELDHNRYFHHNRFKYQQVRASPIFRFNIFRSFYRMIQGFWQSCKILSQIEPDLIIGFGSFYTFPVLLAAKLKKIRFILFEPNAIPGKVNRLFSKWALFSAVQFEEAAAYLKGQVIEVKMPLFKEVNISSQEAREYFYLKPDLFTFLVFGGSQGADSINRLFSEAACRLSPKDSFQVIHIAGKTNSAEQIRKRYEEAGIYACVKSFEDRMELAWRAASAVICRSGAATVAEQINYGVPGILIPFPQAADDHQTKNAKFIEEKVKGGITCPESALSLEKLYDLLSYLLQAENRERMHEAIKIFNQDQKRKELSSIISALLEIGWS